MVDFHSTLALSLPATSLTLRDLLHWGKLYQEQLSRGIPLKKSLFSGAKQAYQRCSLAIVTEQLTTILGPNLKTLRKLPAEKGTGLFSNYHQWSQAATFCNQLTTFRHLLHETTTSEVAVGPVSVSSLKTYFSAHHLVLRSTWEDATFRRNWFSVAQEFGISPDASFSGDVANVIELLSAHPVLSQISNFLRAQTKSSKGERKGVLSLSSAASLSSVSYLPFYLSYNEPLVACFTQMLSGSAKAKKQWESLNNSLDRLAIVLSRIFREISEKKQWHAEPGRSVRTSSVLQQSYTCYEKKINAQALAHPTLTPLLVPLFKGMDENISEWINSGKFQLDSSQLEKIEFLLSVRNKLWDAVSQKSVLDVNQLSMLLTWAVGLLRKLTREETSNSSSSPKKKTLTLLPNLRAILETFSKRIGEEIGAEMKCVLWKYGGKTLPLRLKKHKDLYWNLAKFQYPSTAESVQDRNRAFEPNSFLTPEHKKTILEAIATIFWLDDTSFASNPVPDLSPTKVITTTTATTPTTALPPSIVHKEEIREQLYRTVALVPSSLSSRKQWNEEELDNRLFSMLATHHHLIQESSLLTDLLARISDKVMQEHREVAAQRKEITLSPSFLDENLKASVADVIGFGIQETSRNVLDFVGYQKLKWMAEESSNSESPKESQQRLQNVFGELLYTFQNRLWNNKMTNGLFLAEPTKSNGEEGTHTKSTSLETGKRANALHRSNGNSKLSQSFQTSAVSYLLHVEQSKATIADHEANARHVLKLARYLQNQKDVVGRVSDAGDWIMWYYVFRETILVFSSTFENAHAVNLFLDQVHSILSSNSLATTTTPLFNANETMKIFSSHDEKFSSTAPVYLHPILQLLETAHTAASMYVRGKLWIHLGLFRLRLHIPNQAIDPAHKYTVKSEHVKSVASEVDCEIAVSQREEEIFTGKKSNSFIEKLIWKKDKLDERNESILRKTVPRGDNPVPFSQFHEQLMQFTQAALSEEKVFKLLKEIESLDSRGAARWQTILAQEALWQDTTSNFISKISNLYSYDYPDIVQPFSSSLYHIKCGMRLVQNHKYSCIPAKVLLTKNFESARKQTSEISKIVSGHTLAYVAKQVQVENNTLNN